MNPSYTFWVVFAWKKKQKMIFSNKKISFILFFSVGHYPILTQKLCINRQRIFWPRVLNLFPFDIWSIFVKMRKIFDEKNFKIIDVIIALLDYENSQWLKLFAFRRIITFLTKINSLFTLYNTGMSFTNEEISGITEFRITCMMRTQTLCQRHSLVPAVLVNSV